jgi:hypothetical protein
MKFLRARHRNYDISVVVILARRSFLLRQFARLVATALSLGALGLAFSPRRVDASKKHQQLERRLVAQLATATLGSSPTKRGDPITWWLPAAQIAIGAAYVSVALRHWDGDASGAPEKLEL